MIELQFHVQKKYFIESIYWSLGREFQLRNVTLNKVNKKIFVHKKRVDGAAL